MAKVVAVNVSEKKGTIKHAVEEVEMKEDFGIVGDSHAEQGSIRQISLLGIESIKIISTGHLLVLDQCIILPQCQPEITV